MTRARTLALTLAVVGALAVTALAQGPGGGARQRGDFSFPGIARHGGLPLRGLDLTDAQQEQIRALVQQHREQNGAVAERLRAALAAQRKAAQTIPVDEPAIRATTQELVEAQTAMAIQQAGLRSQIFALLTPEQQAQAIKLQTEREARSSERRERFQQQRQKRIQG
jgi:periplasmic protein CpxP/Spy